MVIYCVDVQSLERFSCLGLFDWEGMELEFVFYQFGFRVYIFDYCTGLFFEGRREGGGKGGWKDGGKKEVMSLWDG